MEFNGPGFRYTDLRAAENSVHFQGGFAALHVRIVKIDLAAAKYASHRAAAKITRADAALYKAKQAGRNRCVIRTFMADNNNVLLTG